MSTYFFGLVVGPFYAHKLISTIGHIRAFTALGSVMSAAALAHPFFIDPWFWASLRFFQGFCIVGMYMCAESWLNEKSTNEIRGSIFALYQITVYLAQGASQLLLNIPDPSGFGLFILTSVLVSLAIVPVALTKIVPPELPEAVQLNLRELYNISPTGIIGALAAGALLGAVYGMGPSFAQLAGLDVAQTTRFMGAIIIGGLILQLPIGKLSDVIDRRLVILIISIATFIISLFIMNKTSIDGFGLLWLGMLYGGAAFTLYPISVAYTNDFAKPDELVPVSAGLLIAYGIGATVGPIAAAIFMEGLGARGLFVFSAYIAIFLTLFIGFRMALGPDKQVTEKTEFQPLTRTTAVISELDPRNDEEASENFTPK
jgi:MFS family permease